MLVVFLHFNLIIPGISYRGAKVVFDDQIIGGGIVFISDMLASVAVPLFFAISGYLFFIKGFSSKFYKEKISKRIKTLVIPYLCWNLIYVILFVVSTRFSSRHIDYSIIDLIRGVLVINPGFEGNWILTPDVVPPADSPLWFIRDLFIAMLLSPLIYKVAKNRVIGAITIIGLLVVFIFNLIPLYIIPGLSVPAILFFLIGSMAGIHKFNPIPFLMRNKWLIISLELLFICFATASLEVGPILTNGYTYSRIYGRLLILSGIPFFLLLSATIIKKIDNKQEIPYSSEYSFIIYTSHSFVLSMVQLVILGFVFRRVELSQIEALCVYLVCPFLTFIVSYYLMRLIMSIKPLRILFIGGR